MLAFVQLVQVGRATTTYESMRGNRHSHGHGTPITNALVTGSTIVDASGGGPSPAVKHVPHQEGCFSRWKKLLGIDTFLLIALHGSKAEQVKATRKSNPFARGMFRNCQDFWLDGPLIARKSNGEAMLGGERVDYTKMYDVPRVAMRYRGEGYQEVAGDDV